MARPPRCAQPAERTLDPFAESCRRERAAQVVLVAECRRDHFAIAFAEGGQGVERGADELALFEALAIVIADLDRLAFAAALLLAPLGAAPPRRVGECPGQPVALAFEAIELAE